MGEKTGIQWADATDNPIKVEGGGFWCTKVSPGCANCYAEAFEINRGGIKYDKTQDVKLILDRDMIAGWAKKTKQKKRFVSSMTDIAGEFVPDEWVFEILDGMYAAPTQIFQVLTKRSQRLYNLVIRWIKSRKLDTAPQNIWLGFSAENQKWLNERWLNFYWLAREYNFIVWVSAEPILGEMTIPRRLLDLHERFWVVAGYESGENARVRHPDIARSLRDQCIANDVPFFFKQWGKWKPMNIAPDYESENWHVFSDGQAMRKVGKNLAGRTLDGQVWSQFPGIWTIFQDVDRAGKIQGKLF